MPVKLLFYVQHLLGVGHIKRASLLVKAWVAAGFDVTVVSGGEAVPQFDFAGARLVQLPAVKAADANFSELVDDQGQPLDEAFKQRRRQLLLETLEQIQPALLVVENYPFGRRQLRWELKPLLQQAKALARPPLTVCSIRDILQRRKPEREAETLTLLQQYVDAVMVHGDVDFIPLQHSFTRAQQIADKLHYTGYVGATRHGEPAPVAVEPDAVWVSAGGGAVGFELMRCCLRLLAQPDGLQRCGLADAPRLRWHLLLGPNLAPAQRRQLDALAQQVDPARVELVLEPLRSDFAQQLRHCRLSISQGGYNTLMDLLTAGCPALVVPFEGEGETEQRLRTERLAEQGYCALLLESELSEANLAHQIRQALALTPPTRLPFGCDGAERSAQLLRQLLANQSAVR